MAIIYVSAPGTGSGGDGSSGSPYGNIKTAIESLTAGDTLRIKTGTITYTSSWNSITWPTGTSLAPIIIEPESFTADTNWGVPGGTTAVTWKPGNGSAINMTLPTLGSSYIQIRGIVFDGENIATDGVALIAINYLHNNVQFRNCQFKNHGLVNIGGGVRKKISAIDFGATNNNGVLLNNQVRYCLFDYDSVAAGLGAEHYIYCHSSGNVFEHNRFTSQSANQPDIAIQFFATNSTSIEHNIVRFNQFDNLGNGASSDSVVLFSQRCQSNLVYGNLFFGCNRKAIDGRGGSGVSGPTVGNVFAYNTIFDCDTGIIIGDSGFTSTVVKNNISYSNSTANYTNNGTSTDAATNGFDGTDPKFTSSGTGDFTLDGTSPYLSGGTELGSPYEDEDILGVVRTNRSYGAYEDDAGVTPVAPVNVYPNPEGYSITVDVETILTGLSVTDNNSPSPLLEEVWISMAGANATFTDVDTSGGATSVEDP